MENDNLVSVIKIDYKRYLDKNIEDPFLLKGRVLNRQIVFDNIFSNENSSVSFGLKTSYSYVSRFIIDKIFPFSANFTSSLIVSFETKFTDQVFFRGSSVLYIHVSDSGFISDVGGTGEDRLIEFIDGSSYQDEIIIKKLRFTSWRGKPIERPYVTLLYYGKEIYFESQLEFSMFNDKFFQEREYDLCPVCGELKGRHLKYCYVDDYYTDPVSYYLCSVECLRKFMRNHSKYLHILRNKKK